MEVESFRHVSCCKWSAELRATNHTGHDCSDAGLCHHFTIHIPVGISIARMLKAATPLFRRLSGMSPDFSTEPPRFTSMIVGGLLSDCDIVNAGHPGISSAKRFLLMFGIGVFRKTDFGVRVRMLTVIRYLHADIRVRLLTTIGSSSRAPLSAI